MSLSKPSQVSQLQSGQSAPLAMSKEPKGKRYPRRVTLDLTQDDYDNLNQWLDDLGKRKVTQADALRAMIAVTLDNPDVTIKVAELL